MAKAPPKAGSKELSDNSLNLAYSGQHPCFGPNWWMQVCLGKLSHRSMPLWTSVDISVCPSLGKKQPRFAQAQPAGYFQMKELDIKNLVEPLKLLSQWMKSGEGCRPTCASMCHYVPTWANIAVCQLCRARHSHDRPELVFVPMAKALPKAGAKLLYSPNLIHEFTSSCSRNVIYASLFGKAFPRKQAFVDISVFLWLCKQQPRFARGQPKGYVQMKELDIKNLIEPLKLLSQWMKSGEGCRPTCANMCHYVPAWANIAVCQLCRERQPLVEQSWWAWT